MARSLLNVGKKVEPSSATPGDVIVFPRGTSGTYGHVGFVKENNPQKNEVTIISGNDRGGVRVSTRRLSSAIGIRRIMEQHQPQITAFSGE
jgi:cell wall-associated NlpC family hydrolase